MNVCHKQNEANYVKVFCHRVALISNSPVHDPSVRRLGIRDLPMPPMANEIEEDDDDDEDEVDAEEKRSETDHSETKYSELSESSPKNAEASVKPITLSHVSE